MTRRTAREHAFMALFAASFGQNVEDSIAAAREDDAEFPLDAFGEGLLHLYAGHAQHVDDTIEANLKGWRIGRLPRVKLAILRLAVTEMTLGEAGMDSVVINEAVELAKKYGADDDFQFINGLLGSVSRARGATAPEGAGEG